ncbi:MAG TPA: hypothetical protein VEZ44_09225 [bacterium]|nr:hypothetical protein [bacterium]
MDLTALAGAYVRLWLDRAQGRYVEGIVHHQGDRECVVWNGGGDGRYVRACPREPHVYIPDPGGRCPYYLHDKRDFEVLG